MIWGSVTNQDVFVWLFSFYDAKLAYAPLPHAEVDYMKKEDDKQVGA